RRGSRRVKPSCYPCHISTWGSRCRPRFARSPTRTRPSSMDYCSRRRARRSPPSPPIPSTPGPNTGFSPFLTPGGRTSSTILPVLHTWGQNLQHHPHVHCIVPGGGLSPDGQRWIACKPGFFLPVRVLSRLFRRLFLQSLQVMHVTGQLQFFSDLAPLKGANE